MRRASDYSKGQRRISLADRIELAREAAPDKVSAPQRALLWGELSYLAEPFRRPFRKLDVRSAHAPRTVMLLPGFATHPSRMRYLARQLERAGHIVKRWGLGFNLGPSEKNLAILEQRVLDIADKSSEPVVLIGWSLGGLFARELAHRHPQAIAKVITMGTPFSGNPRDNNAWRAYQMVAGHRVDAPPVQTPVSLKPPVETIALWSARDGIISPRCARGRAEERDRAIALRCTHMGFCFAPEVITTLLHELARDSACASTPSSNTP